MMRSNSNVSQKSMNNTMAKFACAMTPAAASILIIRTLSITLSVLLVLSVLLLSVLVLRRSQPLTEQDH